MSQLDLIAWFEFGFAACVILVLVLAALAHYRKLKPPNYVFFLIIGVAMAMMIALRWVESRDEEQLRQELKAINVAAISNVVVASSSQQRDVTGSNEIHVLFSILQTVRNIPAHHSHPTKEYDVGFGLGQLRYEYRIGPDSERPQEFWVHETARAGLPGREIGRLESAQLESFLEGLLSDKP